MAALGLCCCTQVFSSYSKPGLLLVVVLELLIAVASLVAEHGLKADGLNNCGEWTSLSLGMWNLPAPGIELMSPALAGRVLMTAPPGKS